MFSSVLLFFEFGAGEIMFIMLVALLLFGGDKLPELARGLGKGIRDFKDASEGVKREITNQIDNFEAKRSEEAAQKKIEEAASGTTESEPSADGKPKFEPPANSMPVAEIGAVASVENVTEETNTPAEPVHLKETPIEPHAEASEETTH